VFLYLIEVQAVLNTVISAIFYYQFHGSTPFEIARSISKWPCYGQQLTYTKIQAYTCSVW